MPLMMCPNCHAGMKEISRENVLIDMCPECHGVWLDRGELQKLLEVSRTEQVAPQPQYQPAPQPQYQPAQPQYQPAQSSSYRSDDRYHHGDNKYRKKSKLESIFDIFD